MSAFFSTAAFGVLCLLIGIAIGIAYEADAHARNAEQAQGDDHE